MFGPIFRREATTLPRRPRFYLSRSVYPAILAMVMASAWLMLTGSQKIQCVGDLAAFGSVVFRLLALLQITVFYFAGAVLAAGGVSLEKDRQTLPLLLMTSLNRWELVGGRLAAGLLEVVVCLFTGLPVFAMILLLGGVGIAQVLRVFTVALLATILVGSVGVCVAYWRDKTFQSLALIVLTLGAWIGFSEVLVAQGERIHPEVPAYAAGLSPFRATLAAADPFPVPAVGRGGNPFSRFVVFASSMSVFLLGLTAARVRQWSTDAGNRERRAPAEDEAARDGIDGQGASEWARTGHVDSRVRGHADGRIRQVWDNPVLWRECITWAHGRRVIFIRVAYLLLAALLTVMAWRATTPEALRLAREEASALPAAAQPLVAISLASLAILNALAVTSITSERDGRSLDLLLATDLSPREFLVGKLGGIASVAGLMLCVPLLLAGLLWWRGSLTGLSLAYLAGALLTLDLFVMMLGIHCGIRYAASRAAISVSLGTFFFLSLGVATCMLMMVSFSGNFQVQLVPFMAIILGGGVGLFVALGAGNPSSAIAVAALSVPFATFYVITSILLQQNLPAFLVVVGSYGFATLAMTVPALFEFDFEMGRTVAADEL